MKISSYFATARSSGRLRTPAGYTPPVRVLVVEDDDSIRGFLVRGLAEEGFAVDQAADGESASFDATNPAYDCVILDLTLPGKDGLSVLKGMRAQGLATPVIILTARDAVSDRVAGLDQGADDYVVKPFVFDELLARIRAVCRRRAGGDGPLRAGSLLLDRRARVLCWGDAKAPLSTREYAILEFLLQHAGEVVSRSRIYEHVWNEQSDVMSNVIDVHVRQIRRKLAALERGADEVIETVRGAGYRVRATAT